MTTFAVQYLGSRPKDATPQDVRQRLRAAFERLPITMVLLDWDLPPALEEAVAEETQAQHAKLYRWQTWLTGDSQTDIPPEWAVIGLVGLPISGYANDPDFTFICPNNSAVEEFLAERLDTLARRGMFRGIFLDRIRFPSPAPNPARNLGCFCRHCTYLAADRGFDLEAARVHIQSLLTDQGGAADLCRGLLGDPKEADSPLERVLDFREGSINRVIEATYRQAKGYGLEVGLDCFSPGLTRMVGQDLNSLGKASDWVKIMTYPRVFGPAGVSFELLDLLDWLMGQGVPENEGLQLLQESTGWALPAGRAGLRRKGLGSEMIREEVRRGHECGIKNLLAGIALVEVKNVHESTPAQIRADLSAAKDSDGPVLSWDLWQIPLETLDTIRRIWEIQ